MVEDNLEEDEPFPDEEEIQEVEEEPAPKRVETRGRPKIAPKVIKSAPVPAPKVEVERVVPFRQQAREGLIDVETKEIIASEIWEALAKIYNKLLQIEDSIGKI